MLSFSFAVKKRIKEIHFSLPDLFDIIPYIFRIACYNRTVEMIVRPFRFLCLIGDTGIKDEPDALIDQPLHMSVRQLCGITGSIGRDALQPQFVYLF